MSYNEIELMLKYARELTRAELGKEAGLIGGLKGAIQGVGKVLTSGKKLNVSDAGRVIKGYAQSGSLKQETARAARAAQSRQAADAMMPQLKGPTTPKPATPPAPPKPAAPAAPPAAPKPTAPPPIPRTLQSSDPNVINLAERRAQRSLASSESSSLPSAGTAAASRAQRAQQGVRRNKARTKAQEGATSTTQTQPQQTQPQTQGEDGPSFWDNQVSDWTWGKDKTPITYGHVGGAGLTALGVGTAGYALGRSGGSEKRAALMNYARELTWAELEKEALLKVKVWRGGQKVERSIAGDMLSPAAPGISSKAKVLKPADTTDAAKVKNLQQQAQKRDGRDPWYGRQISDWTWGKDGSPITYGHAAGAGGLALGAAGGAYMLSGSGQSQPSVQKQAADLYHARLAELEKEALIRELGTGLKSGLKALGEGAGVRGAFDEARFAYGSARTLKSQERDLARLGQRQNSERVAAKYNLETQKQTAEYEKRKAQMIANHASQMRALTGGPVMTGKMPLGLAIGGTLAAGGAVGGAGYMLGREHERGLRDDYIT